jgi:hypothetical protein
VVTDNPLTDEEFARIYGPQQSWTPAEARDVLEGLDASWWVAGGWAIEAFTGASRRHDDIDLSILRRDLPRLREHLGGRFHLWAASDQGLLHLAPNRAMPDHAEQVWVREHSLAPWLGEFLLNPDRDGEWQSKRDPAFSAPVEVVTWTRDGVRYLNPELVLAHKAKGTRPKDDRDLDVALPLLSGDQRRHLADHLARFHPGHPWRGRLADA